MTLWEIRHCRAFPGNAFVFDTFSSSLPTNAGNPFAFHAKEEKKRKARKA
jgi:hypothetical protein